MIFTRLLLWLCIVSVCTQIQFTQDANAQGLTCPAHSESFVRPRIRNDRSIRVFDENRDGLFDDRDIQHVLDLAARRHAETGDLYTVLLDGPRSVYPISNTLRISSGVILDGRGRRIVATPSFDRAHLISISDNSFRSGVIDTEIYTNYRADISAVSVGANARVVFIYDNKFVDETFNDPRVLQEGNGTGIAMVSAVRPGIRYLYIDGNFFLHVPTGVRIGTNPMSNIIVSNNIINQWRVRGISIKGAPSGSIEHIRIIHNRINPPKNGGVRQPIAIQRSSDDSFNYINHVHVNYNRIYNHDEPHIFEYRTDGQGERFKHTILNNASTDSISLHQVINFQVVGNCIINSGEVGITIARRSTSGIVAFNYIYGADTVGIAVGSSPRSPEELVTDISAHSNTIVNPGSNRDNSLPTWARSGIAFINSSHNVANNNTIIENRTRYARDGTPLTQGFAFYEFSANNITYGNSNTLRAPAHVQFRGSR